MPRSRERSSRTVRGADDKVLHLLRRRAKKGVRITTLARSARLNPAEAAALPALLEELQRRGLIVASRDGQRVALAGAAGLIAGTLRLHPDGYGFLVGDDPNEEDHYIPRSGIRPAMDGDRVLARVQGRRRAGEARIVDVLERASREIIGIYCSTVRGGAIEPRARNLPYPVQVVEGGDGGARDGDLVSVAIVDYPGRHRGITGRVSVVLGTPGEPGVETDAIIREHELPTAFPVAALEEAGRIAPTVGKAELEGRSDLRDVPFVTIDGENARDFDDAVALLSRDSGSRLLVAIADVAHYVTPGSAIDREAFERGTSVYFPDRVLPMLPEALSNGICSLNPGVDRLTVTVVLDYDRRGRLERADFRRSVIRSAARLTYGQMKAILVDGAADAAQPHAALVPMLRSMEGLCRQLMVARRRRGSIDFDLPEAEVVLDLTGRPEAIVRAERHIGHQMIEEFMIAANTAVADELKRRRIPSLHRIHEPPDPDRILELSRLLAGFGLPVLAPAPTPADVQHVVAAVEGRPEERLINTVLLRAMKQARYAPEPLGHFGLATQSYTHFTSPIRRYPDLVVHRILNEALEGELSAERREVLAATLAGIAEHSSRRERAAMEAERECVEQKKVELMQEKVGKEFAGHISGVQPFGLFVELQDFFVEGLVHIASLDDDHYEYSARTHALRGRFTGRSLQLGDPVTVRLLRADAIHRRIDFELIAPLADQTIPRRAGRTNGQRRGRQRRP
jgi:ribonuclease R